MRIGFLLGEIKFGGGEKVLQTLINEFHSLGNEILIYSWDQEWRHQKSSLTFEISVLDNPPVGLLGKFKAFHELNKSLRENRPDCLIIFSLALAEVGTFSARFLRIPVLVSQRVDPKFFPRTHIHRFMRKIVFLFSNKIVFQTEEVRKYFSKRIQRKGVVIQNMIMNENIPLANHSNYTKEIIAAGRLSEEKNYPMLIKGFALANLTDYKLRILGEGPQMEELQALILKLDLENRVTLEGYVDDVMSFFKSADIFVLTSNHEGLPNVLIEAMAAELACISTDFNSGGARALIDHGVNGVLIPVNDVIALKEAILFLVENPTLKEQIKLNAGNVRIKNSKKEITPLWVELIKSMIK